MKPFESSFCCEEKAPEKEEQKDEEMAEKAEEKDEDWIGLRVFLTHLLRYHHLK